MDLENLKIDITKNSIIDGWPGEIWIKDVILDLKNNKFKDISKKGLFWESRDMIDTNKIHTKRILEIVNKILDKLYNQKDINDFLKNYKIFSFSLKNYDAKNLCEFAHTISKNTKGEYFEIVKDELNKIDEIYQWYLKCKNTISKNRVFLYYYSQIDLNKFD